VISTFRYKLTVFVIAAFLAAVSGLVVRALPAQREPFAFRHQQGHRVPVSWPCWRRRPGLGAFLGSGRRAPGRGPAAGAAAAADRHSATSRPSSSASCGGGAEVRPPRACGASSALVAAPPRVKGLDGTAPLPQRAKPARGERLLESMRAQAVSAPGAVTTSASTCTAADIVALHRPKRAASPPLPLVTVRAGGERGAVRCAGGPSPGGLRARFARLAFRALPAREDDPRDDGAGRTSRWAATGARSPACCRRCCACDRVEERPALRRGRTPAGALGMPSAWHEPGPQPAAGAAAAD